MGRDGVSGDTGDGRLAVGDDAAVLYVEAADFRECSRRAAIGRDELCDHCEFGVGVDDLAGPVEAGVTLAVGVEIAAIRIAVAAVAFGGVGAAAGVACAHMLGVVGAGVWGVGSGDGICFPNVHFGAAGAVVANTGVGVVGRWFPAFSIGLGNDLVRIHGFEVGEETYRAYLTVDKLHVAWTLRVTVSSAIFCTGLVIWILGHTTIGVHGDKVDGTIQTTRKLRSINIEGNLLTE